jgi:hypothetical protein
MYTTSDQVEEAYWSEARLSEIFDHEDYAFNSSYRLQKLYFESKLSTSSSTPTSPSREFCLVNDNPVYLLSDLMLLFSDFCSSYLSIPGSSLQPSFPFSQNLLPFPIQFPEFPCRAHTQSQLSSPDLAPSSHSVSSPPLPFPSCLSLSISSTHHHTSSPPFQHPDFFSSNFSAPLALPFISFFCIFASFFCASLEPIFFHQLSKASGSAVIHKFNGATLSPNALILLILGSSFSASVPSSRLSRWRKAQHLFSMSNNNHHLFRLQHFALQLLRQENISSLAVFTNALARVQLVPVDARPAPTARPIPAHCTGGTAWTKLMALPTWEAI